MSLAMAVRTVLFSAAIIFSAPALPTSVTYALSPEAPIPIFTPTREVKNEGMGGNVFNNLSSLIAKYNPSFEVDSILSSNNVTKTRYVDDASNHYFIRVDSGENRDKLNLQENRVERLIGEADCIIMSTRQLT